MPHKQVATPHSLAALSTMEPERYELAEAPAWTFAPDRRVFLQTLSAGLLLLVVAPDAEGQWGTGASSVEARLRLDKDGAITVLNGKVEEGQGPRTELAMVAAEELRVPLSQIRVHMADTDVCPDDGITAGSRTTPSTLPAVRKAALAGRGLLMAYAASKWNTDAGSVRVADGKAFSADGKRTLSYADLANDGGFAKLGLQPADVPETTPREWKVLGTSEGRVNGRDIVTGAHAFPSDIQRDGMLYGVVLRPPSYGATLRNVSLKPAEAMPGVKAVRDGEFVGITAPSSHAARKALEAVAATAQWAESPQVSEGQLWEHFRKTSSRDAEAKSRAAAVESKLQSAAKSVKATFHVPYIAHAPMEPRAAVAEWKDGKLTVWTGTSGPPRVHAQLAEAFGISRDKVRVIVPDFGGGFGGKHTGEAALEAARLAKETGKPVSVRWTRKEEFDWAYFRPAALIEAQGGVDTAGKLVAWQFLNYNSGGSAVRSPYTIPVLDEEFLRVESPLRQGSYRALASTANNFAREVLMDELAAAAGKDPLDFRMQHLQNERLQRVLSAVADKFGWRGHARVDGKRGIGIACGEEKNSVVATIAEVEVDPKSETPKVLALWQAYECGAILNPLGLRQQVEGCMMMAMGPVLREGMHFASGKLLNGSFRGYQPTRLADTPRIEIVLVDRKEEVPKGAGETPIIGVAPAVANAVFAVTQKPIRALPIRIARS